MNLNVKIHEGLMQINPAGGLFQHHPVTGWPINTPSIEGESLHIYLQDDLTFYNEKIVEIEKYIDFYKEDIKKIFFYTWHLNIKNFYKDRKNLNFIFYPHYLVQHCNNTKFHKDKFESAFNFNSKTSKFLCLNRHRRKHRDIVVNFVKDIPNAIYSYLAKNIKNPLPTDWSHDDFQNSSFWGNTDRAVINMGSHNLLLRMSQNLLKVSELYNSTCFSLVTETRYNLPFDFVTEKTAQCWVALHPALYVSNRNHVSIIRSWGFDVFDDLFDHSYDTLTNDQRINRMFLDNKKQLENGIIINEDIKERLIKNRNHYFNNLVNILTELHKLSH